MKIEPLLYCVTPSDLSGHRFHVRLHIAKPDPDGQVLFLPAWIPGSYLIRDFSRQIESIKATAAERSISINKTDNHTWQCEATAEALEIDYVVYAWDLSVRSAHLDETHGFFNGTSLLLGVKGQTDTPCLLELNPPVSQEHWKVYTSLPLASNHPRAAQRHGFGMYQAPNYDALIDHPVEMGTPQTIEFVAYGALHELVFTGVIPNLDLERIAQDIQKICESQIALFEPDTCTPPFLDSSDRYVFMTMVTDNDYGGLEHRASTALMIARRHLPVCGRKQAPDGYDDFLGLVSHEYFHTWNVKRIKPHAFAPYRLTQENHTQLLWVFEGFTSYYDDLMLLRSGVISESLYFERLAKTIARVERGAGRFKQSIAESSFDAWTRFYKQDENSPNAIVSYYTKGALFALGLDIVLREASNNQFSLDDVMRLLWQRFGKTFYTQLANGIQENAMPALIHEATQVDVGDFIERYAYGCEDLPLKSLLAKRDIQLERKASSTLPSLGIRCVQKEGNLVIANVYEKEAAHQGGLSAGDVLLALQGLRIKDAANLNTLLARWNAGDSLTIHVFRRDELRQFTVILDPPCLDTVHLTRLDSPNPHSTFP